ncbi:MAG: glycosyltransferase family 4 protein [Halobacteriaceae archaeon]
MRVAVVAATTNHHRDVDRTRRTRWLAERLAARGHDVRVHCVQWWEGTPVEFEHEGVDYHAVTPFPEASGFARRLPGRLRAWDPDVIHAVHDDPAAVVAAWAGSRLAGAPLLVDWYDTRADDESREGLRGAVRERLWGAAASLPNRVLTPSRLVQTHVRELDRDADGIEVIPNAIDLDAVRATDPADGGDVVYSRALDEDANLESLLLALAEFRERDWRATVVGDGPARAGYEQQARDLRIDDRVEFVGEASVAERVALFRNAHVYVHCARRTPFATDLLLALACGCVGIVEYHAASSAHELVEGRERGFLATSDGELVECIGAAGELPHRTVDEGLSEYGEDAVLRRYIDCYRDLQAEAGLL